MPTTLETNVETLAIHAIRALSIDAVNAANSGHPGLPMGAAPMAYALWANHLKHHPGNAKWFNRDRFVLSAGHGSSLLYSLLHLFGYDVSIDDLKAFRKLDSKTPGHPEYGHTDGVEATTGPLGQGIANAVGMAMAEAHLAAKYNTERFPIIDHYTYALVGDGCLMEGLSYEAMSMAGHMKLGKLIVLYDSNDISLDGDLPLSFSEDARKRAESAGWQYIKVEDGNDASAISAAIGAAKEDAARPSLIEIKTVIGFGSPKVAGTNKAHGNPLGAEEAIATKRAYGWPNPEEPFAVPQEAYAHFRALAEKGAAAERSWNELYESFQIVEPVRAEELKAAIAGTASIPPRSVIEFGAGKSISTRVASGDALNHYMHLVPGLFGGSADLSHSTMTDLKGEGKFAVDSYAGRNVYFGVREHAMGAAANGIAQHGGLKPFVGTFFVFNDYLRPAIRLAALQKLPVTYVFTHDSIAVGEDGPTHEPIEHLAALRAIPGLTVIRPGDANETGAAWAYCLQRREGPVALVLSRQNLPVLEETRGGAERLARGGYVLKEAPTAEIAAILIATGSEVSVAIQAHALLAQRGVSARVVAMPSWELFESQSAAYRESVLPRAVTKRVAIEAGVSQGWERYVGWEGATVTIDEFGASGPGGDVLARFGFTAENVAEKTLALLNG